VGILSFVRKVAMKDIGLSEVPDRVLRPLRLRLGLAPYSRRHFENLYANLGDPWRYETSTFEHTKYRRTLEILPRDHFAKILETGCSVGVFTELVAPYGDDILAVDISKVAIQRARQRCQSQRHVRFHQMDLMRGVLEETFDLVLCSDVLPYLNDITNKDHICNKIIGWMAEGGYLVLANAAWIAENWPFSQYSQLRLIEERRFSDYDYKQEPGPLEAKTEYVIGLFRKEDNRVEVQG